MTKATLRLPRKPRLSKPVRDWLPYNAAAEAAVRTSIAGAAYETFTRKQKQAHRERSDQAWEMRNSVRRRADELAERMEKHGHSNALDIAVLAYYCPAAARALVFLTLRRYGFLTDEMRLALPQTA
jgi:hypothetical protein